MAFNLRKPPVLDAKLDAYPYQLDALLAVKDLPYAAIFHEQGLGKTKIAIDIALYWLTHDAVDTVFIVTKKSLVKNWVDEINAHSYIVPSVLSDKKASNGMALNSPVLLYVLNYEVIKTNFDLISLFLETCKVGIILDESQKIKNHESKLTNSFIELSDKFYKRVIMSGTPIANRPYDIWSQINFLDSGKSLGTSFKDFKSKTDIPKERDINSEIFVNTLSGIWQSLQSFAVRETKQSSGIELPSKTILTQVLIMKDSQAKIYANYQSNLMNEFIDEQGNSKIDDAEYILKRLLRLIQCASNPAIIDKSYTGQPIKFEFLQDKIKEIVASNNKVIVWTGFIDNVNWLANNLKQYQPARIHGSIAIDRRNASIERFKKDPNCKIMIATPGAAKEGLTLTIANYTIFYDRGFSLDDYLQAQDRIHRISQTQECTVLNLIAKNSIDEWVDSLLNAKYQASQLAQGDINKNEFLENFDFDLSKMLQEVLQTNKSKEV